MAPANDEADPSAVSGPENPGLYARAVAVARSVLRVLRVDDDSEGELSVTGDPPPEPRTGLKFLDQVVGLPSGIVTVLITALTVATVVPYAGGKVIDVFGLSLAVPTASSTAVEWGLILATPLVWVALLFPIFVGARLRPGLAMRAFATCETLAIVLYVATSATSLTPIETERTVAIDGRWLVTSGDSRYGYFLSPPIVLEPAAQRIGVRVHRVEIRGTLKASTALNVRDAGFDFELSIGPQKAAKYGRFDYWTDKDVLRRTLGTRGGAAIVLGYSFPEQASGGEIPFSVIFDLEKGAADGPPETTMNVKAPPSTTTLNPGETGFVHLLVWSGHGGKTKFEFSNLTVTVSGAGIGNAST